MIMPKVGGVVRGSQIHCCTLYRCVGVYMVRTVSGAVVPESSRLKSYLC